MFHGFRISCFVTTVCHWSGSRTTSAACSTLSARQSGHRRPLQATMRNVSWLSWFTWMAACSPIIQRPLRFTSADFCGPTLRCSAWSRSAPGSMNRPREMTRRRVRVSNGRLQSSLKVPLTLKVRNCRVTAVSLLVQFSWWIHCVSK